MHCLHIFIYSTNCKCGVCVSNSLWPGKQTYFRAPSERWIVWENPPQLQEETMDTNRGELGVYLLFKQIAGRPCLQTAPRTPLHIRCLRVPRRALEPPLRNKQLLVQNSPLDPSVDRQQRCRTYPDWLTDVESTPPGSQCLGGLGDCPGHCAINSNKLVENYLMCVRPLAEYTYWGEYRPLVGYKSYSTMIQ